MKQSRIPAAAAALTATLLLVACATGGRENVIFVTKTSFGADVSVQPAGAALGYDRVEGYMGPREEDGYVPPVAASFVSNGALLDRQIRQVYATGRAAEIVTGAVAAASAASSPSCSASSATCPPKESRKRMFFVTGTTIGLKLGFSAAGLTDTLTLGYKRREASVIPIPDGQFPSVLATLETSQAAESRDTSVLSGAQYFATGTAADAVAGKGYSRDLFDWQARNALGGAAYESKRQSEAALRTALCLQRLPDADLPRVYAHAQSLKLFGPSLSDPAATLSAKPPAQSRLTYMEHLAAADGAAPQRGQNLERHRDLVCALAPAS